MGEKVTTIKIDEDLHKEAKFLNIPLGKTLENALRVQLNKKEILDELEHKKQFHLNKAKEYRKQIEEIEERQRKEREFRGTEEEIMENAVSIAVKVFDNEGGIDDKRLGDIANVQGVSFSELKELFIQKIHPKNGGI